MRYVIVLISLSLFFCCEKTKDKIEYENHIGDTSFNANLDNPNFKFCDSTNILHKRAYIQYTGGNKALEDELIRQYIYKDEYKTFNGYIVIRFAVNCYDKAGRFRTEVLDTDFNKTACPGDLNQQVVSIFKNLKHWNHAVYEGKDYDGYRFNIIKIVNGKIQKS